MGLRRVCPVHPPLVFLISSAVGGWCILCYRSVSLMTGGVRPAGPSLSLVSVCLCCLIIISKLFFTAVSIPSSDVQVCMCACMHACVCACLCACVSVVIVIVKHPVLPPCAVGRHSRNLYYYYYVYIWSCRSPFPLPPPPKMTVEESEYHWQKQFKQVGQPLLLARPVCCSCVANSLPVCSQKQQLVNHADRVANSLSVYSQKHLYIMHIV